MREGSIVIDNISSTSSCASATSKPDETTQVFHVRKPDRSVLVCLSFSEQVLPNSGVLLSTTSSSGEQVEQGPDSVTDETRGNLPGLRSGEGKGSAEGGKGRVD